MNYSKIIKTTLLTTIISGSLSIATSYADSDEHDDDHSIWQAFSQWWQNGHDNKNSKYSYSKFMKPINNSLYKEECGACHWSYLPELLPEQSWQSIMNNLENHFGEDASLDKNSNHQLTNYLVKNSADKSGAKRARKIMHSLNEDTKAVTQITKTPYIIHKHRELNSSIYKREKIASFSNCIACHITADKGIFDDDYIKIPRN